MSRYTITAAGAEIHVENSRVRFQRNGVTLTAFMTDVAGLLIIAAAYCELDGRRRKGIATRVISSTTALCAWVTRLFAQRGDARRHLPLPYGLYVLPGTSMRIGPFQVQKTNAETSPPSLSPADQVTLTIGDGMPLDVSEADFGKLMNVVLIEVLAPMYQAMRSPIPSREAQHSPGLAWLYRMATARGPRMWIPRVLFRPFVWLKSIISRARLVITAESISTALQGGFELSCARMEVLAHEAARTREQNEAARLGLEAESELLLQRQRELAEAEAALQKAAALQAAEHQRLEEAHRTAIAELENRIADDEQRMLRINGQLDQAKLDVERLTTERDNWKAACGQLPE